MKRKLERFRIIEGRRNVVEPSKAIYREICGAWNAYFGNTNPITVELACGRGEYTTGLATRFPDRNFVGVDIKGDRIWKGSTIAAELNLTNAAFLRSPILALSSFFSPGEIAEIWLTFPDPRPRKRDIRRRLTSPRFLSIYRQLLSPGGYVRLKTDNEVLFNYTLEELNARSDVSDVQFTSDLYDSLLRDECFDIRTRYEEQFLSEDIPIKYLRFCFVGD